MHLVSLFELGAVEIRRHVRGEFEPGSAAGRAVAILDFLPLGPERLALHAAATRLGARLIEGRDILPHFPRRTDLFEAVRAAGSYADAVVLRHPLRGAARAAAGVSDAPVLSAGDGSGEDPLFALAELAVLDDSLGGLSKKSVALCGDLRQNRRVKSLAAGLTAVGARVLLVPAKGAEPGESFLAKLGGRGYHSVRYEARSMSSLLDMVDSWLVTPDLVHQLSLFTDIVTTSEDERRAVRHQVREVHALWVASPRDEEGEPAEEESMPLLPWRPDDGRGFVSPARPRDQEVDWAGRAAAETRVLASVLAAALGEEARPPSAPRNAYLASEGIRCADSGCIACREPTRVSPAFVLTRMDPLILTCIYCGTMRKAVYVGSRVEKRYHRITSSQVRKILEKNRVFFANKREADSAGYVSSKI